MMSKPHEPAFPCKTRANTSSDPLATLKEFDWPGMSLRDYIAAQALNAMLSNPSFSTYGGEMETRMLAATHDAYQLADMMLEARGPKPN
jgi:hypothetical protein